MRVINKYRIILTVYSFIPILVMIAMVGNTPVFHMKAFQEGMSLAVVISFLLPLVSPFLFGLNWLFLRQLRTLTTMCGKIKAGDYSPFHLPNEKEDENELVSVMRSMNWMANKIKIRESELEKRVQERTAEINRANLELVEARNEAVASANAKSEFLAVMSHEIRTPINAIIGMTDMVLSSDLAERQKEKLETVRSSSNSLLEIVNSILDFSRMDAGKLALEDIPFNLRDLVNETIGMFINSSVSDDVALKLEFGAGVPQVVSGDPLRLRQVLVNLVSNALKFTEKGEVAVSVNTGAPDKDSVRLAAAVRDTGTGMAADTIDGIFDVFTQADGSTTRKYGGTGLGLAICKKIVTLMGGEIWVESTENVGSTFFFSVVLGKCDPDGMSICGTETDTCSGPEAAAAGEELVGAAEPASFAGRIPDDVASMFRELSRLLRDNSLSAKTCVKEISASLKGTEYAGYIRPLEYAAGRFEFSKAQGVLAEIADKFKISLES